MKTAIYLLSLALIISGVLQAVEFIAGGTITHVIKPLWICTNIFLYPIAGYAVDKILDINKVTKKEIILLWCFNLFIIVISGILTYFYLLKVQDNRTEQFLTGFCLLDAIVIYISVKKYFVLHQIKPIFEKIITETGKLILGIYLLHIFVLWNIPFICKFFGKFENSNIFMSHFGVFLNCITVFIICALITFLLRKIPFVNKLL